MSQRYIGGLIYNPPGGFSGYFDASGDYLSCAQTTPFSFGTGDFCVESWLFITQNQPTNVWYPIFDTRPQTQVNGNYPILGFAENTKILFAGPSSGPAASSYVAVNGSWMHVAWTRVSSVTRVFVNGVLQLYNGSDSTNYIVGGNGIRIGSEAFNSSPNSTWPGYMSNYRVLKGGIPSEYSTSATSVGTSVFTPPSGPLQAITNTSLLTCAYSTFRDGSTNNFTITVNGNTAVSTQNPFPLTQLPNPALGNQGNGVYTMSQYQALRSQNLWPAIDPYFDYVTLLLHGNGTNGAQNNTFLDSSTNNFTITRNGNTTQGTFTPYGSNWSNYFDGTGDSLTVASNSALNGSAFTLEGWFYYTAAGVANTILCSSTGTGGIALGYASGTSWGLASSFVAYRLTTTALPTVNAWNHIVVARSGTGSNQTSIFLNGTRVANGTVTDSFNVTATFIVGWDGNVSNNYFNGYISNLRFVNSDVYGASNTSITVPTAPLTAITGTQLLTCQSNRFIDNSTNNFTITRNGDVSVQRFSPFNPTTPYAAGTIGGSGYFDGSGDYLSVADNAAFEFGSGDFTVELFAYIAATDSSGTIFVSQWNTPNRGWIFGYVNSGTTLNFDYSTTGSNAVSVNGTVTLPLNQWVHFAACRSGNTLSTYMNGARVATASVTGVTIFAPSQALEIGRNPEATSLWEMNGYLAGMRIVKGAAVYDPTQTTITVPTAPPTNITNTSLLLNFTNGGIIDNAMMNDLETVGTAQISTSVSKFGGGSLAFDGTGARLISPSSPNAAMGSGDFTWEAWVYFASGSTFRQIMSTRASSGTASTTAASLAVNTSNGLTWFTNTTIVGYATSIGVNQWVHVAVSRAGTTLRVFANGIQVGSATNSDNLTAGILSVGANNDGSEPFNGNIDDLRITKYARYTTSFTPQRSQWQDQ